MKTILIVGKGRKRGNGASESQQNADDAEATKAGDAPDMTHPAVDGKNVSAHCIHLSNMHAPV